MNTKDHIWKFSKIGGVNRVNLESGQDLLHLDKLDQKLWTALSCPVNGLEIDSETLKLIDTDNDGKIRVPEILESVRWITSVINNANLLIEPYERMPLSVINVNIEEGKVLFESAKQILNNIGKPDSDTISVEETSDTFAIFANTIFNGDGVIIPESTNDEGLIGIFAQIVQCEGAVLDRSGKEGISSDQIEMFYKHCVEYNTWLTKSITEKEQILPYEDNTDKAFQLYSQLKSKIDDYFLRCQLADFDKEAIATLNAIYTRLELINDKELSNCIDEISAFPIAKIEPNKPLNLRSGINPGWKEKLIKFKQIIYPEELYKAELCESEWLAISEKFMAYQQWISEKTGIQVEGLGIDTIQKIIYEDKKYQLLKLIEEDKKLEAEANNIILVEKLVRLYRDIFKLLKNFVSFSDFYTPGKEAIFQAGNLYFDQRSCDLCIKVSDMSKHNSLAASSGICLVYFDCYSKVKGEKMTIVAAFTDGEVDNLNVGRNAVFYDKKGIDWDATIVKIIDNPISIRQAFWSPYRKFSNFVSKQVEKIAASKEQEIHSSTTSNIEKTGTAIGQAAADGTSSRPAQFDIAKFAGIFAAIGLAFGAIGNMLVEALKGVKDLKYWQIPLVFIGLVLAISGPSMIIAWLKLRKRNIAPILDANGWAINAKATINIAFGATLTHLAKRPKNSKLNYSDPFKEKSNPVLVAILIIISIVAILALLWKYGYLEKWGVY